MVRKLGLALCVLVALGPFVIGAMALTQTKKALIDESNRLARESAAGLAGQTSVTLDATFLAVDSIITSAGDGPVDPSAVGASHASISSVAVFDQSGFQISRWPAGSVAPIDRPQAEGDTYIRSGRLLRTSMTEDQKTVAVVVSIDKLQSALGVEGRASLGGVKAPSGERNKFSTRVPHYPLFATSESLPPKGITSWGLFAVSLLGAAAYWLLLRSVFERWRRQSESLTERNAVLEGELTQIQSTFLTGVAKELLGPLSHVLGLTGTLASRWEDLADEKRKLLLDRIGANAEAMDEMVEEMMDFARIQQGTYRLFPRACSLQMECAGVIEKLKPALRDHRTVSMVPEDLSVIADAHAIRRVLEILLNNAVRFSPKGTTIMLRAHRSGEEVVISVDDESSGIPPEEAERIFERFYRRDDERSGPGVDLWIAKGFVCSMGGQIRVETSDRGSTFSFNLPAKLRADLTLPPDNVLVGSQLP